MIQGSNEHRKAHSLRSRGLFCWSVCQPSATPTLNISSQILILFLPGTGIDCLSHAARVALQRAWRVGECYHLLTYWMLQEADWTNMLWINIGSLGQTRWLKCHRSDKWKPTHANDWTNSLKVLPKLLLFFFFLRTCTIDLTCGRTVWKLTVVWSSLLVYGWFTTRGNFSLLDRLQCSSGVKTETVNIYST